MAAPQPTNLTTFENALTTWFRGQTGLQNVVWADQDHPQFDYPFGLITPLTGMGRVANAFDFIEEITDLGQVGQEVELNHAGWREMTVSFQAFVGPPDNNNPSTNARDFLSRAQGSLNLTSVRDTFNSSDIAVIEDLGITKLDAVIEDTFISIANMDIRFMTTSNVAERFGYIKTVEMDGDFTDEDGSIIDQFIDESFGDI